MALVFFNLLLGIYDIIEVKVFYLLIMAYIMNKNLIKLDLNNLSMFFQSQEMSCEIIKAPLECLFVYLGGDKESILQVRVVKQLIETKNDQTGFNYNPQGYYHLQFTWPVHLSIREEAIPDLARLILIINRTCNLPGFEFSEIDKVVYYRYPLLIAGDTIDPNILIVIVGTIILFIMTFAEYLKDVANGNKNLQEVIEEIKHIQQEKESKI